MINQGRSRPYFYLSSHMEHWPVSTILKAEAPDVRRRTAGSMLGDIYELRERNGLHGERANVLMAKSLKSRPNHKHR
jgi:hypothetical protein